MVKEDKTINRLIEKMEAEYSQIKKEECEELHNAIADVITSQKATVQNTLFVLELIKWELLNEKFAQLMVQNKKPATTPPSS